MYGKVWKCVRMCIMLDHDVVICPEMLIMSAKFVFNRKLKIDVWEE
jgi:hypothetical protein